MAQGVRCWAPPNYTTFRFEKSSAAQGRHVRDYPCHCPEVATPRGTTAVDDYYLRRATTACPEIGRPAPGARRPAPPGVRPPASSGPGGAFAPGGGGGEAATRKPSPTGIAIQLPGYKGPSWRSPNANIPQWQIPGAASQMPGEINPWQPGAPGPGGGGGNGGGQVDPNGGGGQAEKSNVAMYVFIAAVVGLGGYLLMKKS